MWAGDGLNAVRVPYVPSAGSLVGRIRQDCQFSTQQQRADDETSTGIPGEDADNDGENCWSYEQVGKHGCCTLESVLLQPN